MADLTINGAEYVTGKMNAIKQFHVTRRLMPVLGSLASANGKDLVDMLPALAESIGKMPDEDAEYVLFACLDVARRKQSNGLAPVRAANGGLMFDDIDLAAMMQISAAVLQENLGGFFGEILAGSAAVNSQT